MGKNRKNKGNTKQQETPHNTEQHDNPETYITDVGETVPTDGHTENFMKAFEEKIYHWIIGTGSTPEDEMDDEEIDYIKNNMESSLDLPSKSLTRIESGYHFKEDNLKVGDKVKTNSIFRSFSRDGEASLKYLKANYSTSGITIYKTVGDVPHFNATKFSDRFDFEKESFVESGDLTIKSVKYYDGKDLDSAKRGIKDVLELDETPTDGRYDYVRIVEIGP